MQSTYIKFLPLLISVFFYIDCISQVKTIERDLETVLFSEPRNKEPDEKVRSINFQGNINSTLTCGQTTIRASDLLRKRKPRVDYFTKASFNQLMPLECIKNINTDIVNLENEWQREDLSNWGRLANQYCSHLNGWVEYSPGTCQAGGPPPLCPAKHWYQDSQKALQKWDTEQQNVRNRRADELKRLKERLVKAACSCWANDIGNNTRIEKRANDKVEAQTSGYFKVMSFDGTCPPGYELKEGYCIPITSSIVTGAMNNADQTNLKLAEVTGAANDKLNNAAGDIAKKLILDDIKTSLSSIGLLNKFFTLFESAGKLGTITLSVATSFFGDPGFTTTEIGVYQSELNLLNTNISTANALMEEYRRLKENEIPCKCRDEKYIKEDLAKLRKDLMSRIRNISLHADFAVKTFDIRDNACPDAFLAFTRKVNELSISVLNSLPKIGE